MISVIAPNLNEQKHLPTFLNGLVNQTFKDFEVIIVDGWSTDNSLKILSEYYNKLDLLIVCCSIRNFGIIRNLGASYAKGEIMVHANTDNYFEPTLLQKLHEYYKEHPEAISVSGRTYPLGTSIIAHLGYQLFDLLRFMFTCAPMPIKKYRPSGNFMSIRSQVFKNIGGHPEVCANEDGLLGQKLDPYAKKNHKAVVFRLDLYVGHWVKKFESMGGLHAIMFYFYTLGNFFPMLQPLLKATQTNANLVFQGKNSRQMTAKQTVWAVWNWL